jgi:hypothetical protein
MHVRVCVHARIMGTCLCACMRLHVRVYNVCVCIYMCVRAHIMGACVCAHACLHVHEAEQQNRVGGFNVLLLVL